jgi:F0F1-type ATP synthase assembly protein I
MPTPPDPDPKNQPSRSFRALSLSAVGIEVALAVAVGFLLGGWLDSRYDTGPYLTVFGGLAGIGAAVKALIRASRQAKALARESNQQPEAAAAPGRGAPGQSDS